MKSCIFYERKARKNCVFGVEQLSFANLCDPAGDFEGCGFTGGVCYGDFCFAGTAVADGDGEGGVVCVAGGILFDNIDLDGMEGEDL